MGTVTLTSTSASPQTWLGTQTIPVGTVLTVENWGAGSGGSRGTSNGAGGGGGAYAKTSYTVTPNDVTNGVSYTLQAGSAGVGAANSAVGPDTSFSTNNINVQPNTTNIGTVVGTIGSGGALPTGINGTNTGWFTSPDAGLQESIVAFGTTSTGLPYTDYRIWGTTSGGSTNVVTFGFGTMSAAVSATGSFSHQLVGGSTTNISLIAAEIWCASNTTSPLSTIASTAFTPGSTLTSMTFTGTTVASTTVASVRAYLQTSGAAAIDITIRYAGIQLEAAAAATFYKSTPGYCLAKGGRATSGTTGGGGGLASACIPTNAQYTGAVAFNGGAGATNAQGGGGGGAAGPDGAGGASTSTVGGTGDNGNVTGSGTSDVRGGSGGLGSAASETAGGAPGGGGGGQTAGSSGTGSAGGRGQIKISWLELLPQHSLDVPLPRRVEMIAY